jgi:hypothetical protein
MLMAHVKGTGRAMKAIGAVWSGRDGMWKVPDEKVTEALAVCGLPSDTFTPAQPANDAPEAPKVLDTMVIKPASKPRTKVRVMKAAPKGAAQAFDRF